MGKCCGVSSSRSFAGGLSSVVEGGGLIEKSLSLLVTVMIDARKIFPGK
jgi:hypothetical protein